MIDAKELRIGNLVYRLVEANILTVVEISTTYLKFEHLDEHVWDAEDINPIPLTSEWLERMGKMCNNIPGWEYQISVGALNWYFRWNTEWYSELGGIYLASRIKYIHQLQNLYFALTGEELQIKLP